MATINMQIMRYINLLDKVSRVKTTKCFVYNNTIFFAVAENMISRAIGPGAINVKRIEESLGKKVKIIRDVQFVQIPTEMNKFLQEIVMPIKYKSFEMKEGVATVTAGNQQSKASLIGRNKRRMEELKKIFHDIFNVELRIV
jgi:transcription antitermination factor NusA-like protein